jgi:hypothetical protein
MGGNSTEELKDKRLVGLATIIIDFALRLKR